MSTEHLPSHEHNGLEPPRHAGSGPPRTSGQLPTSVAVMVRPIAGPTSLGLFGLAGAAFVLSGLQLGWVPTTATAQVALVLAGFAFPAQVIAGVFAFLARDGATATVMWVLGLSWLVMGLLMATSPPRSEVLGLFLLVSAVAVGLTGITAATTKLALAAVLLTAALRFLLTSLYELTGGDGWRTAAGLLGLVLAALGVYAAWALELEEATGRTALPVGRRGKGLVAAHGPLSEQVQDVAQEPGVRTRL